MPKPVSAPRFAAIAPEAAGMPLYRATKRALLQAIESGSLAPGSALPAESSLSKALGVSIGTLRHAVDELVAEFILVRRQGRGTYVATHSAQRFLFQFFHVERADGLREVPEVQLDAFERVRLAEGEAEVLGLRPGEAAFSIENRLLLQGRAVVHDRILLPAALFKGLTEKRVRERSGTLYQMWQTEFGITVVRAEERARAITADRHMARQLGVPAGTPMLQVRRCARSFGNKAVELRVSTIHTALHEYVNTLSQGRA